jgi:hypothetical protein
MCTVSNKSESEFINPLLTQDGRHPQNRIFSNRCDTSRKTDKNSLIRQQITPIPRNQTSILYEKKEIGGNKFRSITRNQRSNVNIFCYNFIDGDLQ